MQLNFGVEAPFALGVEEELLLVDADRRLLEEGEEVVREADPPEGEVVGELFKAMVESNSEVSRNAAEAAEALRGIRRELLETGSRIMGVGVHPDIRSWEAEVGKAPRYRAIQGDLQGVLRTPICGQHVHVGMPDAESAVRAYNGIRTHVPLLNALAANSPFWFGQDSGLASARTVIFRSYPRAAMAPEFDDIEHFKRVTTEVCLAAGIDDYTHIWWDARIHPALGTVEIRAADTQFDIRRTAALAALTHCLVRLEAERDQSGIPSREALAESSFQATRHGLAAVLLDREADAGAGSGPRAPPPRRGRRHRGRARLRRRARRDRGDPRRWKRRGPPARRVPRGRHGRPAGLPRAADVGAGLSGGRKEPGKNPKEPVRTWKT